METPYSRQRKSTRVSNYDFSVERYIDLPTLILFMATLTTFMVIVVIAMPYIKQYQMRSRLKAVAKRREDLKALQLAKRRESSKKPRSARVRSAS